MKLGLLVNFNVNLIKDGIERVVNGFWDVVVRVGSKPTLYVPFFARFARDRPE